MIELYFSLEKDVKEYIRKKYNIIYALLICGICGMVLISTRYLPFIIDMVIEQSPQMILDQAAIMQNVSSLLPNDLKGSIGNVASYICLFYSIVVVLTTYNLLPLEIRYGKWVNPILCGYKPSIIIASKCIVYSIGVSLPPFICIILYFFIGRVFFDCNVTIGFVIAVSLVTSIIEFAISTITISTSLLYKHSIICAISMIGIVLTVPDVLNYFSFGKKLPTYLFTYIYSNSDSYIDIIIPTIMTLFVIVLFYILSCKKVKISE